MSHANDKQSLLLRIFPFLTWLKGYNRVSFRGDLLAGLTVAVVIIPQSMAYAMLIGLPPVYGLYAAAVTPFIASLWGSLRQLSTGPIAIMSLLVVTTLTSMGKPGTPEYLHLAFLLSFMIGVFYLLIGLLKLGLIMAFISHSAVKGFTAAASLIIISTQLPHFLGISVERHEFVLPNLLFIAKGLPGLHLPTTIVGIVSFAIIYGLHKVSRTFPGGLVALMLTTAAVYLFNLDQYGIAIAGESPSGLPSFQLPFFDFEVASSLFGPAVIIALVSFAETYSISKSIAGQTKQKVSVDREFIGQGMANLIGSFFQCFPVSGSFARSAINFSAGAKTGISSVISSLSVVLALLYLTPLLTYIPKAALAALIISAVLTLFHPKEVFFLWKKNRHDGIVALTVFIMALLTKPDYALLIGVIASLMFFLWKTMHPRIVRVTKDPNLNMFVNAEVFGKATCPQLDQLRPDNVIYFANAEYTTEHILSRLDEIETPIRFLLLDLQSVSFIDLTGIDELRVLKEEVEKKGINLAFMGIRIPVMKVFKSSGFFDELKPEHIIENRGKAITYVFDRLDHEYCKNTCPLVLFKECSTVK